MSTINTLALVIHNPHSGPFLGRVPASRIRKALSEAGIEHAWKEAPSFKEIRHCAESALKEGYMTVIASGGDGTVREIASVLAGSGAALGIIPRGTANLFARDLGIPQDPLSAVRIIHSAHIRLIDVGLAGARHFVLMCGIGIDARTIRYVIPPMKRWLGWWSYLYSAVLNFFKHKPFKASLYLDFPGAPPVTLETPLIVIGNARAYGPERLRVAHLAQLDDGLLDVCVFRAEFLHDLARHFFDIMRQETIQDDRMLYLKTSRMRLVTDPPVPFQLDGDWVAETPLEISIMPRSLRIYVPVES
ncbi:MAG: diacylglycerol kinase family lipid kinase [Candidatus Omnitrophica bacterium]|nr:diacylglycerol kinase family lipid kinase [Candidatus Omnitrophota bacterium]